jgi:hypothetical protein
LPPSRRRRLHPLLVLLVPFVLSAIGAAWFKSSLRAAHACSCGTGDFWVLERVSIDGAQASWPSRGNLWGDMILLDEPGAEVWVWYSP